MKVFVQITVEVSTFTERATKKDITASVVEAISDTMQRAENMGYNHKHTDAVELHVDSDNIRILSTDPE